jgi:hypothetical protein
MSPQELFDLTGAPVLPGWIILIAGPQRFAVLNATRSVTSPSMIVGMRPLGLSARYPGSFKPPNWPPKDPAF